MPSTAPAKWGFSSSSSSSPRNRQGKGCPHPWADRVFSTLTGPEKWGAPVSHCTWRFPRGLGEREKLGNHPKRVSEWWRRSDRSLCKKTKLIFFFFLMIKIILHRRHLKKKKKRKKKGYHTKVSKVSLVKWERLTRCSEWRAALDKFRICPTSALENENACWVVPRESEGRAGQSASSPAWHTVYPESILLISPS